MDRRYTLDKRNIRIPGVARKGNASGAQKAILKTACIGRKMEC
jgi:hypothetical protein